MIYVAIAIWIISYVLLFTGFVIEPYISSECCIVGSLIKEFTLWKIQLGLILNIISTTYFLYYIGKNKFLTDKNKNNKKVKENERKNKTNKK